MLQGDRKQHKSVQRGNLFDVLDRYAGLPIGRLTKNWRQQNKDYKAAVDAIARGDIRDGYDMLAQQGLVKQTPVFDHNAAAGGGLPGGARRGQVRADRGPDARRVRRDHGGDYGNN